MKRLILTLFVSILQLAACAAPTNLFGVEEPTPTTALLPTDTLQPEPTASPSPAPMTIVTPEPATPEPPPSAWIAYVGTDGNLWLGNPSTGELKQLTQDARPWQGSQPGETVIYYASPRWSSDGRLLAYTREMGIPVEWGYQFDYGLWVYDFTTGEERPVLLGEQVLGLDWKPGTHLIAYGRYIDPNYFLNRANFAQGIWAVEADTGEVFELVPPERGYTLVKPQWSPDGGFLGFDEVFAMEGRGWFAFYDFEAQEYHSWDETIGSYTWLPSGKQIAYDRLSYVSDGSERIWLNTLQGGSEMALISDYEPGFAFFPVFSPRGDWLAYLASLGGTENTLFTAFVIEATGGLPRSLGEFEQAQGLTWSPDGEWLALSAGPYDRQQVLLISVASSTSQVLDGGSQPAWQPTIGE